MKLKKRQESLDSKLCKLRITTLVVRNFPKELLHAVERHSNNQKLSQRDRELVELHTLYLERFPHPSECLFTIPVYTRNLLLAFSDFIDNPDHCHGGALSPLYRCKSILRPLQLKQRVELVKVVTTLMTATNIETGFIGEYLKDEKAEFDEKGNKLLSGIRHVDIRSRYSNVWGAEISHTKYSDCINMLKLAGHLEIESCYLSNEAGELKRHEMRLEGATPEELEEIPRYRSIAAYKFFSSLFFDVFTPLLTQPHMIKMKMSAAKARVKKKLSTYWYTYSPFSDGFFTRKRKVLREQYPQGFHKTDPIPIPQSIH